MDITSPASVFLSDDAQDEISGVKKKNMKCLSCGHRFAGETYASCPDSFSSDTEEVIDENDDRYWRGRVSLPDDISRFHHTDLP